MQTSLLGFRAGVPATLGHPPVEKAHCTLAPQACPRNAERGFRRHATPSGHDRVDALDAYAERQLALATGRDEVGGCL